MGSIQHDLSICHFGINSYHISLTLIVTSARRFIPVEYGGIEYIAIFRGHPTNVHAFTRSPDGTLLASGGFDGTIMLWDMKHYMDDECP